jgi:hypothetical protein
MRVFLCPGPERRWRSFDPREGRPDLRRRRLNPRGRSPDPRSRSPDPRGRRLNSRRRRSELPARSLNLPRRRSQPSPSHFRAPLAEFGAEHLTKPKCFESEPRKGERSHGRARPRPAQAGSAHFGALGTFGPLTVARLRDYQRPTIGLYRCDSWRRNRPLVAAASGAGKEVMTIDTTRIDPSV